MTVYGITPQGFVRKTQQNILDEMAADERSSMVDDIDTDPDQPLGQVNGTVSRQISVCWEQLEVCHNGLDPDMSEGRLLEFLSKLTGTYRRGSTPSEVILACDLDDGTVLIPGTHFAAIEDHEDVRWTPSPTLYLSNYTTVGTGTKLVTFVCELDGAVPGLAGTINVIATPVVGWKNVVNPNDAELGFVVDTDPQLRVRREAEIAAIGSATRRSLYAKVSQAFRGKLTTLAIFENDGDNVDTNGQPPHSMETLIFDGDVPSVDDNALAQVIHDTMAGGIEPVGNTSGVAVETVNGAMQNETIPFSRAEQLPTYLIINLVKKPGSQYAGDQAVIDFVVAQANLYFAPGDEIVAERIRTFTMQMAGVKDIISIKLGFSSNPVGTSNLPVTIREIGRFSTSRTSVISS